MSKQAQTCPHCNGTNIIIAVYDGPLPHDDASNKVTRLARDTKLFICMDCRQSIGEVAEQGEARVSADWTEDQFGALNLRRDKAHVWIQKRPYYCDRGHYVANVSGIPFLDAADSFPRYFMRLEIAKQEMEEWLEWRLQCEANNPAPKFMNCNCGKHVGHWPSCPAFEASP